MLLALILVLPLLGAFTALLTSKEARLRSTLGAAIPTTIALVTLGYLQPAAFSSSPARLQVPWIPDLGLHWSFQLDALSWLFALLVLGIGLLVIVYAHHYLGANEAIGRFYAFLCLFMGSMLGVVLSGNLLLLVIFWELTSLTSFLLINFWGHQSNARKGARMALTITGAGGLSLLAGTLLLGQITGSFEFETLLASGEIIRAHHLYPVALALVLIGAFTKSAQFPFLFWLPHAMAAPTPVSAYLHSATMVKAGIFLLARLYPVLGGTELWANVVVTTGLLTMLIGAWMATAKNDIKGLLAYSTVSHLGLITMLLGMNTPLSNYTALFHVVNHATFKAALFMVAGVVDHETGSRDLRRLSGMRHYLPVTFVLAIIATSAMAGVPLLNGFLSKEMFLTETLKPGHWESWNIAIPLLATLGATLSAGYSLRFVMEVFFGPKPVGLPIYPPQEAAPTMLAPIAVLAAVCVFIGIYPAPLSPMLEAASHVSMGDAPPPYTIALWHGFNLPLAMSIAAVVGGIGFYRFRNEASKPLQAVMRRDAKEIFEDVMQNATRGAALLTKSLETGTFQRYAAWMVVLTFFIALHALTRTDVGIIPLHLSPIDPFTALATVILAVGALTTVWAHAIRLQGLLTVGVSGLMVALIFARFGAPDLALTQLAVEVVTVAFIMLALYFIPYKTVAETGRTRKIARALISGAAGLLVAVLTYLMLVQPYETIAPYYVENALPGGGGTNVVNVILVDFRAFDTLGEITVLAIAAIGIVAMLHNLQLFHPTADPQGRNWANASHPLVLEVFARIALPFAVLVAMYLLLRGHNLPGGGFVAGLVTSAALLLQYIAGGSGFVEERFHPRYEVVAAVGIGIAGATGLAALAFGAPFLTSAFTHLDLPLLGEIEIASAFVFDIGVYLAVTGSCMLCLATLGKLNLVGDKDL